MKDEILVKQLKNGDGRAFGLLYEKYKNLAIRTAYLITNNLSDSEDVVQETFVKAYLHIAELKNDSGFKAWMMQILVRTAYRAGKKSSREIPDDEAVRLAENQTTETPLKQLLKKEEAERISRAVAALPVKQRAVVVLYYYHELSVKEIAKLLGCLEGTVKSRLHTARKCLKEKLSEEERHSEEKHPEENHAAGEYNILWKQTQEGRIL